MDDEAISAATMTVLEELHAGARDIFEHALRECDIAAAFDRHLHFEGRTLVRHPSPRLPEISQPLDKFKKIFVIALGKAALGMMNALLERLPPKSHVSGVCSAPQIPKKKNWHIRYYNGGHPLPNDDSFAAAKATLDLLKHAKKDTFIFFLISGGGSAMMELPRDKNISLDDTIAFHETLVASGATITEVNTVRKYFSAIKGGRLALAAPEAEKLSLLLADVPLKDLAAVASSPTLPDYSTPAECAEILARFHLLEKFPPAVRAYF
ncbi:MAG: glycerate-2-kinase family protein, partial [Acidobacteriaceae bacterium]